MSMRKRQEVQKMSRRNGLKPGVTLAASLTLFAWTMIAASGEQQSAIWPDKVGLSERKSTENVQVSGKPLWEEYGLNAAERAEYSGPEKWTGTAYRLKTPTGALAAWQWLRPADAKPAKITPNSVTTGKGALVQYGNYVLEFAGGRPEDKYIRAVIERLPKLDQSALPSLTGYLPASQLVPNSERYILGPASLQTFAPGIPPSVAAFHLESEAQLATYHGAKSDMQMLVFSYPTPQIARQRLDEFQKLPGLMVKRAGPLLVMVASPSDANEAESLLSKVTYQADVTWNNVPPKKEPNPGELLLSILILAAVLIVASVLVGVFLGGFRVVLSRFGIASADNTFTSLDIGNK
jgi:hypothetical protein